MQLIPYPEYKDSGVPWLGKIPAHWPEKRAKYYFKEVDERSQTGAEEMLSVSHITGVTPRSQKNVTMFKAESNVGQKLCQPGDLVINTMWAWMSALGVSHHAGIVSPAYGVYRPRTNQDYDNYYLDHLLRIEGYRSEYICRSTGIRSSRLRLYPDKFLSMRVVCPPLDEQQTIAQFLKAQDRLFRKFIRNKRRLVELLKEQKQNIINQAVTRGLDANVRLKSSGVEWIGDIPEHWEARRLRTLVKSGLQNGIFKKKHEYGQGTLLVNVSDLYINDNRINVAKLERVEVTEEELHSFRVEAGDIFFVRSSLKLEGTGKSAYILDIKEPTVFECHVVKCQPKREIISPHFFSLFLNSTPAATYLISRANTVTMSTISQGTILNTRVCLPSLVEQRQILEFVDNEIAKIDQAITRAQREIELMREYRTRLIADVVTGQVDVRGIEVPEVAEAEVDASSPLHDEDTAEADDLLDADEEVEAGE